MRLKSSILTRTLISTSSELTSNKQEESSESVAAGEPDDDCQVFDRSLSSDNGNYYLIIYPKAAPPTAILGIVGVDLKQNRNFDVRLSLEGRRVGNGGFRKLKGAWDAWVDYVESKVGEEFPTAEAELRYFKTIKSYRAIVKLMETAIERDALVKNA